MPKVTLPKLTMPKMTLPKVTLPKLSMPKWTLPTLSLPRFELPKAALRKWLPSVGSPDTPLSPSKLIAGVGVLLVLLTSWAVLTRPGSGTSPRGSDNDGPNAATAWLSSGEEAAGKQATPAPAAPKPTRTAPPAGKVALPPRAAAPVPAQDAQNADSREAAVAEPGPDEQKTPARVKRLPPPAPSVGFVNSRVVVGGSAHFVEVRVRRTGDVSQPASFTWWTEDGTALSGFEYIGQPRLKSGFGAGKASATLFVKVAGSQPRRQAAKFDIVIGDAGSLTLNKPRATVTLLPGR
jgi:hypothetical protein